MKRVMLENSDSDFGVIEMRSSKNNVKFVSQDQYEITTTFQKSNKFILTEMKREDIFFYKTAGRINT